jgi:hypothetical protein
MAPAEGAVVVASTAGTAVTPQEKPLPVVPVKNADPTGAEIPIMRRFVLFAFV